MQLSREDLLKAYHQMRTIRDFEERVHDEFSAGNIPGFVHLYAGEEASGVGFCMHLTDVDRIASTHRGHGHCIAKGCDTRAMMHEIFGRKEGLCGGKGGSMHIADLEKGMMGANGIVGGGPPLDLRRSAHRQDAQDRWRRDRLRRRRRLQPGHHLRELQPRQGLEPAGDLRRRGQWLRRVDRQRLVGRRQPARSGGGFRHAGPRGRRSRLLRRLRGRPRGDRACAGRRRAEPGPRQAQPLFRAFRRRCDDLSRRRTRWPSCARPRIRCRSSASAWSRRPCSSRRTSTASTQEVKSHIDQVTVEAKAAPMPTEKDLLTDVYVSY